MDFEIIYLFFFFKQKTAYDMRISDWSSDVCSSDLARDPRLEPANVRVVVLQRVVGEADAAAAIRFDQRGRGALAEAEFDQRRNLRGRASLAVLADRGNGRLHARLLGLQPRDLVGDLLAGLGVLAADPGGADAGGLAAQFVRALALRDRPAHRGLRAGDGAAVPALAVVPDQDRLAERNAADFFAQVRAAVGLVRSEEHTSELQSLMRISYAVLCLKNKTRTRK